MQSINRRLAKHDADRTDNSISQISGSDPTIVKTSSDGSSFSIYSIEKDFEKKSIKSHEYDYGDHRTKVDI